MKLNSILIITVLVLAVLVSCGESGIPSSGTLTFSFEQDMEGWTVNGTDLDNPPVEWSIERCEDIASDGKSAVRLYLNNMNDAGKIWIERPFDGEPNCTYQVHVEYDFASADWGDMNLWTIITGVVPESAKMELVFQGDTGNNTEPKDGFVWLRKSYDFNVKSGPDGKLYAIIGVWGTWETARTYYLDNINISFTAK